MKYIYRISFIIMMLNSQLFGGDLVANAGEYKTLNITPSNRAVHLDGSESTSSDEIVSYKWYEGDKYIGSGQSRWYVLTQNGEHNITLKVTDSTNETAEDSVIITVVNQVVANAGTDITVDLTDASDTVQLDGSASSAGDNILTYEWFENGSSLSTEATFAYAPATVGTHIVTLKVKDNMGTEGEDEVKIIVNSIGEVDGLQADAGEDKILNITPSNRAVHLDGSASSSADGIVSYKWYEGDKYIGSGKSRWYVLTENGEHNITLKVTDTKGVTTDATIVVTVICSSPIDLGPDRIINMAFSEAAINLNGTIGIPNENILRKQWFEDDRFVGLHREVWYLLTEGTHTITLRVTLVDGETCQDSITITVINDPNKIPPIHHLL